jgi:hypothetical protein
VSERGFIFDLGACGCQNIKFPCRGSRYGGGEPARASSEAEPHPRGCPALERGGDAPEGASSPRARWRLTRGGVQPPSEAETHSRGRSALERGGTSLEGASTPRARRSFARGWPGLAALVGRWGHQVRGPLPLGRDCACLCFVSSFALFTKEMGFSPVV